MTRTGATGPGLGTAALTTAGMYFVDAAGGLGYGNLPLSSGFGPVSGGAVGLACWLVATDRYDPPPS